MKRWKFISTKKAISHCVEIFYCILLFKLYISDTGCRTKEDILNNSLEEEVPRHLPRIHEAGLCNLSPNTVDNRSLFLVAEQVRDGAGDDELG